MRRSTPTRSPNPKMKHMRGVKTFFCGAKQAQPKFKTWQRKPARQNKTLPLVLLGLREICVTYLFTAAL